MSDSTPRPSRSGGPTFTVSYNAQTRQAAERRQHARAAGSVSAGIHMMVARYVACVEGARPKLSTAEWGYLEEVGRDVVFDAQMIGILPQWVAKGVPEGHPARRFGIDPARLGKKLDTAGWGGLLAVVDHIEFTAHSERLLLKRYLQEQREAESD